jgi:AmmeMemoRadiSam system protein B
MSWRRHIMPDARQVRRHVVAGMFYPEDPGELGRNVDALLASADVRVPTRRIVAVVAPHAGYMYSGPTAAGAYARLRGAAYDTVVIVSPSHRESFDGVTVYPGDAYSTPLGDVPVDGGLRAELLETCRRVSADLRGHGSEHALEVQLPFLQRTLGRFRLLPLVIGHQDRDTCFELGDCLGRLIRNRSALLVASTDLSHYHSAGEADRLDGVFIEGLDRGDEEALMRCLEEGSTEACGGGPVVAVLRAARGMGAAIVEVTDRSTSADVTGDRTSVVGYVSAVAYA